MGLVAGAEILQVRDLKPLFLSGRHAVDRYLQLVSSSVGEKLSSTKLLMKFKELLKVASPKAEGNGSNSFRALSNMTVQQYSSNIVCN